MSKNFPPTASVLPLRSINKASNIAFLVFGDSKAVAVKQVVEAADCNTSLYRAQLIQPIDNGVTWFMDDAAAALLDS